MNGSVVVDASLAVKWLVEEDDSDKVDAILQSWVAQGIRRIAPYLMPFEVANALHRRVLHGDLSVADSVRMIARLLESSLELHQPPGLHVRALQLASQLNQSAAYDAPLPSAGGECQLRVVDSRREILPGSQPRGLKTCAGLGSSLRRDSGTARQEIDGRLSQPPEPKALDRHLS